MEREQITIRLPAELMERLRREAQEKGTGVNALVLTLLNEEKNRQEKLSRVSSQSLRYVQG